MTIEKIRESWKRVTKSLNKPLTCSELIGKSFDEGYVSHFFVAGMLDIDPNELALLLIDSWDGVITPDNGMGIDTSLLHKVLLQLIPLYKDSVLLGKEGILVYRNSKLNTFLGYRQTPSIDLKTLRNEQH